MNDPVKYTEDDIGKVVCYYGHKREIGRITSFNSKYVFVRFGREKHSKACHPQDLSPPGYIQEQGKRKDN